MPKLLLAPALSLSLIVAGCDPATQPEKPESNQDAPPPRLDRPSPENAKSGSPAGEGAADLIRWLLADDRNTDEVPFTTVVRATTGKEILPIDSEDPVSAEILAALGAAMDATLEELNTEVSPVRGLARINEASRFFEEEMLGFLEAAEGFTCAVPTLADGTSQRSGYPDLRLVHTASGRVTYIDPKLFGPDGRKSSLRTFYFEPKNRTNKILDDAHHILVGIEHDGNDGAWLFKSWHAVDLQKFKVRLKAEFQASNKDLYTPEQIVLEGGGGAGQ